MNTRSTCVVCALRNHEEVDAALRARRCPACGAPVKHLFRGVCPRCGHEYRVAHCWHAREICEELAPDLHYRTVARHAHECLGLSRADPQTQGRGPVACPGHRPVFGATFCPSCPDADFLGDICPHGDWPCMRPEYECSEQDECPCWSDRDPVWSAAYAAFVAECRREAGVDRGYRARHPRPRRSGAASAE